MRPRTSVILVALLLVAVPMTVVIPKGLWDAGDARCQQRTPADAWGYSIEWDWSEFGFICSFNGRDYQPTGEQTRVGLTDLF